MFNLLRKKLKSEEGFTLVELMVVVVIIGVLTAIAVQVYNASTDRAEQAADDANIRILNGAVMQYTTETGASIADIANNATITNVAGVATESDATISGALISDYILELPLPTSGVTYTYDNTTGQWSHD